MLTKDCLLVISLFQGSVWISCVASGISLVITDQLSGLL